jgi:hypothetical protein
MTRTTRAPKADAAKNGAAAPAESAPVAPKTERLTSFKSHGQMYYRVTVPRNFGAAYNTEVNRWTCNIDEKTGVLTFTPAAKLVKVS